MSEATPIDCGDMINQMLGLDPGMLGVLSPADGVGNDRALLGLGVVVRRSLELSLQLRDRKSLTLRLKSTDKQARAWGFGDVASARVGMLLLWASLRARRYCRGYAYVPLKDADDKVVDLAPRPDAAISAMSNIELAVKAFDEKPFREPTKFDETTPDDGEHASLWDLSRDVLGLYPGDLATALYDTKEAMIPDLVGHPQQLSGNGLCWFWRGVLEHFAAMHERDVRKIQLRTESDAYEAELPGARAANLMTIMAASLFADRKHRVVLRAPEERREEEVALLLSVARYVYANYTPQLFDGLALLCESNRHFGHLGRFSIADRLLHSIRGEFPPESRPPCVRALEAGLGLPSQQYRWKDAS